MSDNEKFEQFARDCWYELVNNRGENRSDVCAAIGRCLLNGSLAVMFAAGWTPKLWADHHAPSVDPSFKTSTLINPESRK